MRPSVHRSVYFLTICIGLLCGIGAASSFVIASEVLWTVVLCAALLALNANPRVLAVGVFLFAAVAGVWRTQQILNRSSVLWDLAGHKADVSLTGYVDGDFETTDRGGRYSFHVTGIQTDGQIIQTQDRVLVNGPDWVRPLPGQWLVLQGKLQHAGTFDDFDYESYLAKDGIHATMYFPRYTVPLSDTGSLWRRTWVWADSRLATMRLAVASSLGNVVRQPESGYLAGILVGAKGNVSPELKDAFARTGTSHILAISGYNITIIASVLVGLLAPLGRRRAYWFALAAITLFTVMVGAGASVVRAAIMGVMAMTAQRMGRVTDAGTSMSATAAVMCWLNPLLLRWDVGFQLSFLAFAGIVYVQPLIEPTLVRLLRWKSVASMVATTISAQVLVLPLLLWVFGTLAVYTLPANILVLPLVPIAMALGLATAVATLLWPFAGALVAQSAWLVAAVQLWVVRFFASLPHATLTVHLSLAVTIAIYVTLVAYLFSLYRGRTQHA